MAEPPKFALKDALWRNLSSQYLEDSLLCSSPKDAAKWLLVSKDINEVIEENRARMRRFDERRFKLRLQEADNQMILLSANFAKEEHFVDCRTTTEVPTPSSSILELLQQDEFGNCQSRLRDTSPKGIQHFIKRAVDWFSIERALFRWGSTDLEVLRPLAERGVWIYFRRKYELDDSLMDAIEGLHIRNIYLFCQCSHVPDDSLLHRLHEMPLETVRLSDLELLRHLNCPFIHFDGGLLLDDFVDAIVIPWFNGERPRLKMMTFNGVEELNCPPFELVDYVPTESEAENNRRIFLLMDKKAESIMEVKVDFTSSYSHVEMRIESLA